MPDQDKNTDSSLIWINRKAENETSFWVNELTRYFAKMKVDSASSNNGKICTFENDERANANEYCTNDMTNMNPKCSESNGYGYFEGKPCVLIKLNKIYEFVPHPMSLENLKNSTAGVPQELIDFVASISKSPVDARKLDSTWITCEGENPGDKENIGDLKYFAPGLNDFHGIPNYYFPYMNQKGYQTPFVFVKFLNPRPRMLIQIECKAWAKNIAVDRLERRGSVHLELLVD